MIPRVIPDHVIRGDDAEERIHDDAVQELEPMPHDGEDAEARYQRAPELPGLRGEVPYLIVGGDPMQPMLPHGSGFLRPHLARAVALGPNPFR